ncbi:MAG: hypothetical protein KAH18_12955 [Psychromonas sp.]|nr:hypothetical protein [Psychromonas sp.]
MGWDPRYCIYETTGSSSLADKNFTYGAMHLGYKVITCNKILHAEPAYWSSRNPKHFDDLEFHSKFINFHGLCRNSVAITARQPMHSHALFAGQCNGSRAGTSHLPSLIIAVQ